MDLAVSESCAVAALERRIAALEQRIAALEAGRGPRDAQDQALVVALAVSTKGLAFTGAKLWRHRDVDSILAEAPRLCLRGHHRIGSIACGSG